MTSSEVPQAIVSLLILVAGLFFFGTIFALVGRMYRQFLRRHPSVARAVENMQEGARIPVRYCMIYGCMEPASWQYCSYHYMMICEDSARHREG